MMFQAAAAFALELIALGIGFWVLLKMRNNEAGNLKGFGTFIGYFIIVFAFFTILCTGYYTVKYWEDGYYNKLNAGQMMMMHRMNQIQGGSHGMMMGKMGMNQERCRMMMDEEMNHSKCKQMMKGEMEGMMDDRSGMQGNEDHAEHHPENDDK